MELNNWHVDYDEGNDEYVVIHYVGGEDYMHVESAHDTLREANARKNALNGMGLVGEHIERGDFQFVFKIMNWGSEERLPLGGE